MKRILRDIFKPKNHKLHKYADKKLVRCLIQKIENLTLKEISFTMTYLIWEKQHLDALNLLPNTQEQMEEDSKMFYTKLFKKNMKPNIFWILTEAFDNYITKKYKLDIIYFLEKNCKKYKEMKFEKNVKNIIFKLLDKIFKISIFYKRIKFE